MNFNLAEISTGWLVTGWLLTYVAELCTDLLLT